MQTKATLLASMVWRYRNSTTSYYCTFTRHSRTKTIFKDFQGFLHWRKSTSLTITGVGQGGEVREPKFEDWKADEKGYWRGSKRLWDIKSCTIAAPI